MSSFFLRKRGRSLTTPSNRKPKPGNADMKKRVAIKRSAEVSGATGNKGLARGRGAPGNRSQGNQSQRGLKRKDRGGGTNRTFTKKPKFDPNEVIESSTEEENEEEKTEEKYEDDDDDIVETAQEKKVRLAKIYLEEIEKEEKQRHENEEVDVDLLVAKRLREDILETEGRLRREVADTVFYDPTKIFSLTSSKHLKKSVTCLCISPNEEWIFSGCKDGQLFKWSLNEKKKVLMVKRKEILSTRKKKKGIVLKKKQSGNADGNSCHSSTITSIAISSDGKFLATGDLDKQVVIWDPETLNRIHIFTGHRGPIRGLVFRHKSHTLYSCSDDRSIRIWSLDEMGYVETLFGHQDAVTSVDALSRERAISSGGRDNSLRVWKIVEESQLVYNGHYGGSVDVVKLINEENFLSGGDDGLLCTWNVNRKKALVSLPNAHGIEKSGEGGYENPRWISALAAWTNTDLVASGSNDGFLRLWKCGERFKSLTSILQIPCQGWINSIQFSHGANVPGKFIAVGIGKEHKAGRWSENVEKAKHSIMVIPLISKEDKVTPPSKSSDQNNKIINGHQHFSESENAVDAV